MEVLSFYSLALTDTKADSERESVPSQGHGETQEEVTRFNLDDKELRVEAQFIPLRSSKDYGGCPSRLTALVLFA